MLIYSYTIIYISNLVMLWGLFMIYTMIGLMKMKSYNTPILAVVFYFFLQEFLGVLFVCSFSYSFQLVLILLKGGLAPFHFWMGKLIMMTKGKAYLWMLTWQKLPYYLLLMENLSWSFYFLLLMSGILPLFQSLFSYSLKYIYFLLLTSSGNNLLILGFFYPFYAMLIIPFYLSFLYWLPGNVTWMGDFNYGWEVSFTLFSFPGSLPFFIKLGVLSSVIPHGGMMIIIFLVGLVMSLLVTLNCFNLFFSYMCPPNKYFVALLISYFILMML